MAPAAREGTNVVISRAIAMVFLQPATNRARTHIKRINKNRPLSERSFHLFEGVDCTAKHSSMPIAEECTMFRVHTHHNSSTHEQAGRFQHVFDSMIEKKCNSVVTLAIRSDF